MEDNLNYEEERKKLRLGPISIAVILLKATIGVGIFSF